MATQIATKQSTLINRMAQQPCLLGDVDDWTGSTSSVKRRKLQNRINQRAHRKRKREEKKSCSSISSAVGSVSINDDFGTLTGSTSMTQRTTVSANSYTSLEELWCLFHSTVSAGFLDHSNLERLGRMCRDNNVDSERSIAVLQQWIQRQTVISSPRADCLLVLVKFNVFRALMNNGKHLGFSTAGQYHNHDAISPFFKPACALPLLPAGLCPTGLQSNTPHHPSLDLLPDPIMRDNLIRANGAYDKERFFADLIGLFSASAEENGLVIWGEPWDPSGWEVTEAFLRDWGWALRGCEELLRATNFWRQKRGARPLRFHGVARI